VWGYLLIRSGGKGTKGSRRLFVVEEKDTDSSCWGVRGSAGKGAQKEEGGKTCDVPSVNGEHANMGQRIFWRTHCQLGPYSKLTLIPETNQNCHN